MSRDPRASARRPSRAPRGLLADFFKAHGIDPELGIEQFKSFVRELIRHSTEDGLTVADESIEASLERGGLFAEILRSQFSDEEIETTIRVERILAERGLSWDQTDELLDPKIPRSRDARSL